MNRSGGSVRLWLWQARLRDEIAGDAVIAARAVTVIGATVVVGALLGGFPSDPMETGSLTVTAAAFAIVGVITAAQP